MILQLVAAQQVDAVEGGVVGKLVELVAQVVVLLDQVAAHDVAADGRGVGGAEVAVDDAGRGGADQRQIAGREVGDPQPAAVVRGRHLVGEQGVGVDAGDDLVDGLRDGASLGERAVGVKPKLAATAGAVDRAGGDDDVGGAV